MGSVQQLEGKKLTGLVMNFTFQESCTKTKQHSWFTMKQNDNWQISVFKVWTGGDGLNDKWLCEYEEEKITMQQS